ncbi:hypothetical protein FB566_0636 [Stackebrandtia endophytica]|uniref:Uncharacterized protein n=1 Tax=Stackebrandtia endophytica TaxID=1496996 RepID=A0A543ARD7_9ACTN|nr:hypothetical protein [Stackebrandtia endophytica]TQL75142.1 hypothetical protein FB566_0636 [Stackebrandtia endophytica]
MNDSTPEPCLPVFRSEQWDAQVNQMVHRMAPTRFSVVGHDPATEDSAILAWGLDYGNGEVIVDSVRDNRRWYVTSPEDVFKYFPRAPGNGLEIIWIDNPT